ncbi:EF-P 5-aminopentanol modification-associated protein YfmF [Paenisporosarcina cavernae]|uniref:Insulinase family protein n=1 Tax=Paenisporosarcina cavernae TaxID=2320858 RepID=A0A385YRD7_9BACL|nr:pitrilysin family protein [Paenisporosarcina cavernae]AYC29299.1 insulinase family protein [Paenisporosarcina cavernae]
MFHSTELKPGIHLHTNNTDQFKTLSIAVKFRQKLSEKDAALRSVLANVLNDSNKEYCTNTDFRSHLDELYGTGLSVDVSKRGNEHTVQLSVETVNDRFLAEDNIMSKLWKTIHAVLFQPNFENNSFKSEIVEREKATIVSKIESIYDDKTRYAQYRLLQEMRPNHPASVQAIGTIEAVRAITPKDLAQSYQSMIEKDAVDIYVVGQIKEEEISQYIEQYFPLKERFYTVPPTSPEQSFNASSKEVDETQSMKQGKLHIGYSSPITFWDKDFPTMQIMNGIFGGYAHSKLFLQVREKESLAYYVSSNYQSPYGLMFVLSGIDPENKEKAEKLIDVELLKMTAGEFSELELEQTVAMLKNQLKEALDSSRGQIEIFDAYKDLPGGFSIEALFEKWNQVTKENIQEVAKTWNKEVTYFLSGKE